MVRHGFRTLGKISIGFGYGKRFALGFCIDEWSINMDIGPFWFYLEW